MSQPITQDDPGERLPYQIESPAGQAHPNYPMAVPREDSHQDSQQEASVEHGVSAEPVTDIAERPPRLVGIDAARGLALLGLMAVHILPSYSEETGGASVTWLLFSGNAAALFALLAGLMLATTSGGQHAHQGRMMAAYRVGLLVRAVLISVIGLMIGGLMPPDPPAYNILIYYGVFFVLAIPFLRASPKVLFAAAALIGIASPVLMQVLGDQLPAWYAYNPTIVDVLEAPGATASQLLLTGSYPALTYLAYLLVGMGLGRLDLRRLSVQLRLLVVGLALTVFARVTSYVLLYALGGYGQLRRSSGMGRREFAEALIWDPDSLPTSSGWWLAIATPHANTPVSIAASLGVGLAVLGAFLLIARKAESWLLPLAAMGAMTLTLYTAHLVLLSFEVHYEYPFLWFLVHLLLAVAFAVAWRHTLGKGPLEKVLASAAQGTRGLVLGQTNGAVRP